MHDAYPRMLPLDLASHLQKLNNRAPNRECAIGRLNQANWDVDAIGPSGLQDMERRPNLDFDASAPSRYGTSLNRALQSGMEVAQLLLQTNSALITILKHRTTGQSSNR